MDQEKRGFFTNAENMIRTAFAKLGDIKEIAAVTPQIEAMPNHIESPAIRTVDIARVYLGYLRFVRDAIKLDETDLAAINTADIAMKESSADNHTTEGIFAVMGPEYRSKMLDLLLQASSLDSPIFETALTDLQDRMKVGSDRKAQGKENSDKVDDPQAKYGVFTQTKEGMQPTAQVHVVIGHGLTRALSATLSNDKSSKDLADKKDYLLHIIGDAMHVKLAKAELGIPNYKGKPIIIHPEEREIFEAWVKSPPEGGLTWSSRARYEIVKEAVKSTYQKKSDDSNH